MEEKKIELKNGEFISADMANAPSLEIYYEGIKMSHVAEIARVGGIYRIMLTVPFNRIEIKERVDVAKEGNE